MKRKIQLDVAVTLSTPDRPTLKKCFSPSPALNLDVDFDLDGPDFEVFDQNEEEIDSTILDRVIEEGMAFQSLEDPWFIKEEGCNSNPQRSKPLHQDVCTNISWENRAANVGSGHNDSIASADLDMLDDLEESGMNFSAMSEVRDIQELLLSPSDNSGMVPPHNSRCNSPGVFPPPNRCSSPLGPPGCSPPNNKSRRMLPFSGEMPSPATFQQLLEDSGVNGEHPSGTASFQQFLQSANGMDSEQTYFPNPPASFQQYMDSGTNGGQPHSRAAFQQFLQSGCTKYKDSANLSPSSVQRPALKLLYVTKARSLMSCREQSMCLGRHRFFNALGEQISVTFEVVPSPNMAMERIGKTSYNGVIYDFEMAGLDGLRFTRFIAQAMPDLPIVLVNVPAAEAEDPELKILTKSLLPSRPDKQMMEYIVLEFLKCL
mmetsp:Transcript_35278/g.61029  ORF Transcript_35278/g.61029 Transcript_35278/m.61029 type:complete len:430 (-) Transcript_35278:48-1337(-)|eukprot:CAMPEP_0206387476 /NCGR_PEP_ID=MMETSP0294-20121207/16638_1 /ASSEMBLY_ACC=CAM_ASM_000327 /TAXON_ID=39354 /ORGANISM="Heterosigma akashiwo, Strain CCMP2393" /LENGTH=429 /DNA_ID=CAMNT_0053838875 /DNA_START=436 /DNA_END=1725 /DNA_ORIENTATION=-